MRRCLSLISLLVIFAHGVCQTSVTEQDSRTYNMLMLARGHEVTGLCVMNVMADSSAVGTVINEFGVKVFDFTFENGKAEVLNVLGPLDRWYIRRVLRRDFTFLLNNMDAGQDVSYKKRRLTFSPQGEINLRNDRYKISYSFSPMKEEQ